MFLEIAAQGFEAGDFLNIFLRFVGLLRVIFLSKIFLGVGHKILYIISTPFPFFFPISIFPYIAYFSFLIQGPSKRVKEEHFRIPLKISYHLQIMFIIF